MKTLQPNLKFPDTYDVPVVRVQMIRESILSIDREEVSSIALAARILVKYLELSDREQFCVITLDTKNAMTSISTVHIGTLNSSLVSPRDVFKVAILANASSIIIGHNHPSGDPTPSPEDIALTNRLVSIGREMDIPVADHIIVGDNGRYRSFCSAGML
jgi:DNA repair protein RadC